MQTIKMMQAIKVLIILSSMLVAQFVLAQRTTISIVGSSTVYPFTTLVAEVFGQNTDFNTPKVESTGTGGGMKLFCSGIGTKYPDITNASRRIKSSEQELCKKASVTDIFEIKVGFDGIAIASSKKSKAMDLSLKHLYLALAKKVPNAKGKIVDNPYTIWSQIDPKLPNNKIKVYGPPPTSGTRDAFVEIGLEGGAKAFDSLKKLRALKDKKQIKLVLTQLGLSPKLLKSAGSGKKIFQLISHGIREDGHYIEAGENDNLIIQKLKVNPNALGIFGFSYLEENSNAIRPAKIDGINISFESIADSSYPISRALYIYVKKQHLNVIPGLNDFLAEYTSEEAWSEDGYLADRGLIPLNQAGQAIIKKQVAKFK